MGCKITSLPNGQVLIDGAEETLTIVLHTTLPCKQVVMSMGKSLTGNKAVDKKITSMLRQCFQKTFSMHSAFYLNDEVLAADDIWKLEIYDASGCLAETIYNDGVIANEFVRL